MRKRRESSAPTPPVRARSATDAAETMLTLASAPRSLAAPTSSVMTSRSSSPTTAESAAAHGPATRWPGAGRPKKIVSNGSPSSTAPGHDVAFGELERQRPGRAVERARHERQPHRGLPVDEAPGGVDEMQASVLGHAVRPDVGALDLAQREPLDRGDGDPRDACFAGRGLHLAMLARPGSTAVSRPCSRRRVRRSRRPGRRAPRPCRPRR